MYKGKIVKITDEEAFVMVKEYEFVRIKTGWYDCRG